VIPLTAPAKGEFGRVHSRAYPDRPFVGVGAVIIDAGRVVLVKRQHEPLKGQWSLPGGAVEVGETLEAGLVREIEEETGLHVTVGPVIEVLDRITRDPTGRVQYHFVLIDYLCWPVTGALRAGSDVDDVVLADPGDLDRFDLGPVATAVIARAFDLARQVREAE
jgi:8-oxo-dGTP diphosphatase